MRIAIFTSGRQDWGILQPVRAALAATAGLTPIILAGGMHRRGGAAPRALDGVAVDALVDGATDGRDGVSVAAAAGAVVADGARALRAVAADALVVVGDRTETLAMALAATCLRLPIVHLHGGETTLGAIDDACRHAITKLAHLHCAAHPACARRIVALCEPPERVRTVGAPALDALWRTPWLDEAGLAAAIGRPRLGRPLIALTFHPTTLGGDPAAEAEALVAGVARAIADRPDALVVATRPNTDVGGDAVGRALDGWARRDGRVALAGDLGTTAWWSLLRLADALVGNSSSGVIEAPSFGLPVVEIGRRQEGRLRVAPALRVAAHPDAIAEAVAAALARREPTPRALRATEYGDGRAGERIAAAIAAFAAESPEQRLAKTVVMAGGST